MRTRWQKSLQAAVAAENTPMPWARGEPRKAMIARRTAKEAAAKSANTNTRKTTAA